MAMKLKSIIIFSLLLAFSFSTVHAYTFSIIDDHHSDAHEYVHELDSSSSEDTVCDIHAKYHQAYIFSSNTILIQKMDKSSKLKLHNESYTFSIHLDLVIPPIA